MYKYIHINAFKSQYTIAHKGLCNVYSPVQLYIWKSHPEFIIIKNLLQKENLFERKKI